MMLYPFGVGYVVYATNENGLCGFVGIEPGVGYGLFSLHSCAWFKDEESAQQVFKSPYFTCRQGLGPPLLILEALEGGSEKATFFVARLLLNGSQLEWDNLHEYEVDASMGS